MCCHCSAARMWSTLFSSLTFSSSFPTYFVNFQMIMAKGDKQSDALHLAYHLSAIGSCNAAYNLVIQRSFL